MVVVESEREIDDKVERETRFYITSLTDPAEKLATAVRQHWAIENKLHWKLDVIFEEDSARSRKDYAPENLAVIRRIAHNILSAPPSDKSIRRKMKLASWSKDFLFELFTHMR